MSGLASPYGISIFLHVLAAFVWLGGMMFLGVVGAPVLRQIEPPSLRARLFHVLGVRFRTVGWIAIAILVVTGVFNLYFRGWLSQELLADSAFWNSRMGWALGVKLTMVVLIIAGSLAHDFWIGPASSRADPGSDRALMLSRRAALLGRVNAFIGLILLAAAVSLARGL